MGQNSLLIVKVLKMQFRIAKWYFSDGSNYLRIAGLEILVLRKLRVSFRFRFRSLSPAKLFSERWC